MWITTAASRDAADARQESEGWPVMCSPIGVNFGFGNSRPAGVTGYELVLMRQACVSSTLGSCDQ